MLVARGGRSLVVLPGPRSPRARVLPRLRRDGARDPRVRNRRRPDGSVVRVGSRVGLHVDGHGLARDEPARVAFLATPRVSHHLRALVPAHPVTRVPILAGSRLVVVTADDDALVLRPPAPVEGVADVGAAVRDALRFPLAGEPLEALVARGARATI